MCRGQRNNSSTVCCGPPGALFWVLLRRQLQAHRPSPGLRPAAARRDHWALHPCTHLPPSPASAPRLLFVGKTTLAYMRQIGSGEVAAATGGRGGQRGGKAKAEPQPADRQETEELPARRRRTRRD